MTPTCSRSAKLGYCFAISIIMQFYDLYCQLEELNDSIDWPED